MALGTPVRSWCLCSSASRTKCLSKQGRVTQRGLQGELSHWSQLQQMLLYDFVALFQAKNTPAAGAGVGCVCRLGRDLCAARLAKGSWSIRPGWHCQQPRAAPPAP